MEDAVKPRDEQSDRVLPPASIPPDPVPTRTFQDVIWMPNVKAKPIPMPVAQPLHDPTGAQVLQNAQEVTNHTTYTPGSGTHSEPLWVLRLPDGRTYAVNVKKEIVWSRWDGV